MKSPRTHSLYTLWGMPVLLAALTIFGLLSALLGTGVWHYLSWLALFVPLLTIAWHTLRPQARRQPARVASRQN